MRLCLLFLGALSFAWDLRSARCAAGASEDFETPSQRFFAAVADSDALELSGARDALGAMEGRLDESAGGPVPILHHLLNAYRLTNNPRNKVDLVDLMIRCLHMGVDGGAVYGGDPPLLFKSVLVRELNLTKSIAERSPEAVTAMFMDGVWAKRLLSFLYAIPAESVPLVKLLLHADTIVSHRGQDVSGGVAGVQRMLEGASLGKPAVRALDLALHSPAFRGIVAQLGAGGLRIPLLAVVGALDETAAAAHGALLGAASGRPQAARGLFAAIGVVDAATRRNALHFLGISGGAVMLMQLEHFLQGLSQAHMQEGSAALRAALQQRDRRGHSPVSYAVLRFSAASPIGAAMQSLCTALGADFDALAIIPFAPASAPTAVHVPEVLENSAESSGPGSGGWSAQRLGAGDLAECGVLEVSGSLPSNREFFARYVNTGTPVVFRGAAKGLQELFERERFVKAYGDFLVPAAAIPYASSFGVPSSTATLAQVASIVGPEVEVSDGVEGVAESPLYAFSTPSAAWAAQLLSEVPVPRSIRRSGSSTEDSGVGEVEAGGVSWSFEIQFYLGPAGSGAPAHFHGHAINSLAFGEKQWILYPPAEAFYSTTPALAFFPAEANATGGTGNALRCTQQAGDVLYVPALWGHATLNSLQSIGVAHEFSVEPFCME
ncbi:hypothetical protein B484DRAFT_483427 [Ochromonadaceae sp. CCMP2298]|nr:hypothetical protein B484DRAFT_483427 [Ochromonadaceae sp. CCMP2298]